MANRFSVKATRIERSMALLNTSTRYAKSVKRAAIKLLLSLSVSG
jgi:hypothetical protein